MTGFLGRSGLWISWEKHRRTASLVNHLGVEWVSFHSRRSRFLKHPLFLWRTLVQLMKRRPRVLIVQNPSVFLTFEAILLKKVFGYQLVVDAHNAGVYPPEPFQEKFSWAFPMMHRGADLTIVTNESLARIVRRNGGRPFVLPDPLPEFPEHVVQRGRARESDQFVVSYICTFSADEPWQAVLEASLEFPADLEIHITGNYLAVKGLENVPRGPGVLFRGFLPEDEFVALLAGSDLIVDLTTRDDCMVCGAYEAVALEVPMVLSDTPALRDYFTSGRIFSSNDAAGIREGIGAARRDHARLQREVAELKESLLGPWNRNFERLRAELKE